MVISLQRLGEFNGATIGLLRVGELSPMWTLERPSDGNVKGCIPAGMYNCIPHGWNNEPVEKKQVWEVKNVSDRQAILLHVGNTVADTEGCILVGCGVNIGSESSAITQSKNAIDTLRGKFFGVGFTLNVLAAPFAE